MEEPTRIGMSATSMAKLDELVEELNPLEGDEGTRLIKFDLYRLAVALGIKNRDTPSELSGKSIPNFRTSELDEDGILYLSVKESKLVSEGDSIYGFIERLAEQGINELYSIHRSTGQLPFEDYFKVK